MPRNILIDPQRTGTNNPNIQFSGSMANTIRLEVLTSGSVQFTGVSGSLFSITDSLSGSLFAVSDVSGLPVLEVFSDDKVVAGRYGSNTLVVTGSQVGIGTNDPTGRRLFVVGTSTASDTVLTARAGTATPSGALLDLQNSSAASTFVVDYLGNLRAGTSSQGMVLDFRTNGSNRLDLRFSDSTTWYINPDRSAASYVSFFENTLGGQVRIATRNADGSNTLRNGSVLTLDTRYWNGSANVVADTTIQALADATSPDYRMRLAAGTGQINIRSNGNVGVGVTNPGYTLDVGGAIAIRGNETADNPRLYFQASDQSNRFTVESDLDGTTGNDLLGFRSTTSDNILVLKGDGNIAIGSSAPSGWRTRITGTSGTGTSYGLLIDAGTNSSDQSFRVRNLAGSADLLIVRGDGNVGIGSTTINAKLDVNGAAVASFIGGGRTVPSYSQFEPVMSGTDPTYGSDYAYFGMHRAGNISWQIGLLSNTFVIAHGGGASQYTMWSSRRFSIDAAGNVGIGITNATNILTINKGNGTGLNIQYDNSTNVRTGLFLFTRGSSIGGFSGGSEWDDTTTTARSAAASTILAASGELVFYGNTGLTPGSTFTPTERARFNTSGHFVPGADNTYDLGLSGTKWRTLHATNISGSFTPSGATAGSVFFAGVSGQIAQDNSNFFWDDANNRLGIGTNVPQKSLEVITTASDYASVGVVGLNTNQWTGIHFGHRESNTNYRKSAIVFERLDSAARGKIHILNNHDFNAASATLTDARMTISSSGDVGIGGTGPTARLEVTGSTNTSAAATFHAINSAGTSLLFVRNDGPVGIGTGSPTSFFQVSSVAQGNFRLDVGGTGGHYYQAETTPRLGIGRDLPYDSTQTASGYVSFTNGGGTVAATGAALAIIANRTLSLFTSNTTALTPRMTIDGSGNVGIGLTNPSVKLHVIGSSVLADNTGIDPDTYTNAVVAGAISDTGWAVTSGIGGNAGTGDSWAIGHNGSNLYFGIQNGSAANTMATFMQVSPGRSIGLFNNVGIGTTTPGYSLDVNGSLNIGKTTGGDLNFFNSRNWYEGSTATVGASVLSAQVYSNGRKLYPDETFSYGTNGIVLYDNAGSGQITVTRISSTGLSPASPNNSGYVLQVQHTGGGQVPAFGGFTFQVGTRANATLVCVFKAYLPTGYALNWASNATGTNSNSFWASTNSGTGAWQDYVYVLKCGATGTFSSSMFFYVTGSPTPSAGSPLTWYISSATVYDLDDKVTYVANSNAGSGATNYLSKWTSASNLGTSVVYDDGTNVSVGSSANPGSRKLAVNGIIGLHDGTSERAFWYWDGTRVQFVANGATELSFWNNSQKRFSLDSGGNLLPGANVSYDIGSSGTRWRDVYARTGSFSGDVSITGDLTVLGTQTIVNSTVVEIGDNIITLNSVASPQRYGGLYVNDTTANTTGSLLWDSDNNYWIAGLKGSEAVIPTGTGTSGLVARWTGTTTLSTGVLYDNGTNVGVGAASDGTKLYVRYDNASSYTSTGFNTATLHLRNGTGTSDSPTMLSFSSNWSGAGWYLGLVEANTTNQANFVFQARTGASTTAERMRIDTSGNVGINMTPSYTLDVTGISGGNPARFSAASANASPGLNAETGIILRNTNATVGNYTSITNRDSNNNANAQINLINVDHTGNSAINFVTRVAGVGFGERARFNSAGHFLPGADNTYDLGASGTRWRTLFATNISGTLTPTGATAGSVFFAGVSGQITQDNANFFWDDANNRLGIGTATPSQTLDLNGSFLQDKLWNSARQSIAITLGTESWINLATIPNNCNVQFMYRIGSSNSEEEGTITVLGTYYNTGTGETNITVNRQTYNEHLREVHVTQTAGGSNKTVYIKVRSNSSAPSLYWRIVMSQGGALNHTGDSVTINNTDVTATPPSGGKSLIVNGNSVYASTLNNIHYGSMSIGGGNSFSARLLVSGSGNGTTSSTMHLLNSSNTSLMFVRDDGFVGISTTAPAASSVKLQVGNAGSLAQVTSMVVGGGADKAPVFSLLNSGNREGYIGQSTTALYIGNSSGLGGSYTDSNLAANAHVTISTGGLVGIGSTTPTAKLHVSDTSSGTTAILRNSDSGATLPTRTFLQMLGLYNNGSNGHQLHFHSTAESGVWEFNITKDWGGIVTLGASTDGTSRVRHLTVKDTGNVGVGTTNPGYKLHVRGAGSAANVRIESSTTADGQLSFINTSTSATGFVVGLLGNTSGDGTIYHNDAKNILISTNATERARIDSSGNVGIGTATVTARLHVNGSSTAATPTMLVKEGVASPTGGALAFEVEKSNGSTIFAVSGSGFVGIGTSIPNATFEVVGVSGSLFSVTDQLSGSLFSVNTISGLPILEVFSDNTVVAGAYSTNALVVTGSRVGMGTNGPDQQLDVRGNISLGRRAQSTLTRYVGLVNTDGTFSSTAGQGTTGLIIDQHSGGDSSIRFKTGTWGVSEDIRMMIDRTGNVGIGTTVATNASYAFSAGGGLSIYNGTQATIRLSAPSSNWDIGSNSNRLYFYDATNTTERMRIDSSGNVSIGNAASSAAAVSQLHLMTTAGGDVPRLTFTNGTTGHTSSDGSFIGISNGTQLTVWNKESSEILFATNNIERMRIDSSGRSVWSTGPAGATASTTNGLQLWYDSTNNKGYIRATQEGVDHRDLVISGKSIDFWNQSGASRMFLDSAGNVGIGTTIANGNKLAVNGQVSVTGSLLPGADNLYDLGSTSYRWANIYAVNFSPTSVSAQLTGSNLTNGMVLFANATGGITGSQSQFFWDNTNSRLGIGTSTPGQKLDVIGSVRASSTLLADTGATIGTNSHSSLLSVIANAAAGQYKGFGFQSAGSYRWYFTSNNTAEGGSNAGSDLEVRAYADAGTYLSSPLLIKRSTGNIGISTTSPGSRLTIGTDFASITGVTIDTGNTSDSALIARRAASKPAFSILPWDNEVYIGSGIYYDTSWTHHSDSGYNQLLSLKPNTGVIWWSSDTGTASWNLANNILLWDPGARWKSSVQSTRAENSYFTGGFVGIGTASPSNLLHLYATSPVIRMQGSTDSAYLDYNNTRLQVSAGGGYLQVVTANTVRWITDLSGNVYPSTTEVGQLGTNTNQWIDVISRRLSLGDNGVYVKSRGMILNAAAGTTGWRKVATLLVDANDWQSGKPFELLVRRYYSDGGFGNEYAKFVVSVDGYASTISTVFKGTYVEGFGASISFAIQNFTTTGSGATLYYTADVMVNVAQYLTYHVTINYSGAEFSSVQYPSGATTGIVFGANYNTTQVAATGDIIQFTTPSLFFERGGLVGFGTTSVGSSILTAQSTAANWAGLTMKNSAGTTGGLIGLDAAGSGGGSTNMSVTAVGTLTFGSNNSAKASLDTSGNFLPNTDNSQNVGSSTLRWANVHATNIISSGSLGPSYTTPTSTVAGSGINFDGTAIYDTITLSTSTTPGALYEMTIIANPNSSGNGAYRDVIYGKIIVGTGYNGSVGTSYIQFINESPAPRSLYPSGGGSLTADVVFLQSGTEYTSVAQGGTATIRVKIWGYWSGGPPSNGAHIGSNTTVRLKQIA